MTIVPIKYGDAPIPERVIWRSREAVMKARGWPQEDRDDVTMLLMSDPAAPKAQNAIAALTTFRADLIETLKTNEFNHQLAAYRVALARLARYRLAVGQAAVYEDQPTGEYDAETGEPITESVLVQPEIEPLPTEIEVPVVDEETGEQTGTEMIPNPEIERDDAERAAARAVVDQTPQPVKAFPVA
ncbi:hypothetical protein [Sulfitobacter sp. SH24]|uniref:hypothetical protein n=1 Tax=Sulfitobacter sp. SH24 TaxID=3421173 RepID=UPI003F5043C7